MSFFVDTNVVVYAASDHPGAPLCQRVIEAVATGQVQGVTSAAVIEELLHLELSRRIPGLSGIAQAAWEVFAPVLSVNDVVVRRALQSDIPRLGANDRIHTATCLQHGIADLLSADGAFGAVRDIRRIDPFEPAAVDELLAEHRS